MRRAWAFPGQGSQTPRMGAQLNAFSGLCEQAEDMTGIELRRRCINAEHPHWPAHELQQAIFVTTIAAAISARRWLPPPQAVVGHSLGEYAALVQAEVLDYETALQLVDARGRAMAQAGAENPGAMVAIRGLTPTRVGEICEQTAGAWPANINSSSQTVVSGTVAGVESASRKCEQHGAAGVTRLPITIACHTPLMAPAAERVASLLAELELRGPTTTFYSTVDAAPKQSTESIASALIDGITKPVQFSATVERLLTDGVRAFVEVGPGRILGGLLRDAVPRNAIKSITSDIDAQRVATDIH